MVASVRFARWHMRPTSRCLSFCMWAGWHTLCQLTTAGPNESIACATHTPLHDSWDAIQWGAGMLLPCWPGCDARKRHCQSHTSSSLATEMRWAISWSRACSETKSKVVTFFKARVTCPLGKFCACFKLHDTKSTSKMHQIQLYGRSLRKASWSRYSAAPATFG